MWLTGLVAPRHVGSSQPRARTRVPCIGRQILNHCATREALASLFGSFLEFPSFCLHYPFVLTQCLLFSISDLNILIIVILNFLSDNSQICVTSESGTDACLVSSDCVSSAFHNVL